MALAGRVIASHYAKPVERKLCSGATLRAAPSVDAGAVERRNSGDLFLMLDESLGWAWGYAGEERRVGYVLVEELARQ